MFFSSKKLRMSAIGGKIITANFVLTVGSRSAEKAEKLPTLQGAITLSIMTLIIMTLCIMTLSIMTLSIMTLSIMTLSIMTLSIMTLGKCDICARQKILFMNETKRYKIWLRPKA
jgi:hypothetical protein